MALTELIKCMHDKMLILKFQGEHFLYEIKVFESNTNCVEILINKTCNTRQHNSINGRDKVQNHVGQSNGIVGMNWKRRIKLNNTAHRDHHLEIQWHDEECE